MPIIPIPNGTHSIIIECTTLTSLKYCQDDSVYKCEYSNWAFGLFAIAFVITLLLPVFLMIKCCIHFHYGYKKHMPDHSRQTSESSLYPNTSRDLHVYPNEDEYDPVVQHHHPKRVHPKEKLYFDYPAYGTFGPSLQDSATSSIYLDLAVACPNQIPVQSHETLPKSVDYLSNSAPVVSTMLRDCRQQLCDLCKVETQARKLYSSLQSLHDSDKISQHSFRVDYAESQHDLKADLTEFQKNSSVESKDLLLLATDKNEYFSPSSKFESYSASSPSTSTTYGSPLEFKIEAAKKTKNDEANNLETTHNQSDDLVDNNLHKIDDSSKNIDCIKDSSIESLDLCKSNDAKSLIPKSSSVDIQNNTEANNPIQGRVSSDKNRILSATPTKHMVTRQDFDDYLADCVSKLPEDQRNGTFLIRNSTTTPNSKVLTLFCKSMENNGSLYYFKIYFTEESLLYLKATSKTFNSVDELILHYRSNRSILPCLLADCLGRSF